MIILENEWDEAAGVKEQEAKHREGPALPVSQQACPT